MPEDRELERVYDELKLLGTKFEALREAVLEDHGKMKDQVQAQALDLATTKAELRITQEMTRALQASMTEAAKEQSALTKKLLSYAAAIALAAGGASSGMIQGLFDRPPAPPPTAVATP